MAKNNPSKKLTQSIALSAVEFIYLFLSLVLIYPTSYFDPTEKVFSTGFCASTVVYAFGILYPLITRFIKGEISADKRIRIANIVIMTFALLSIALVTLYYLDVLKYSFVVWFAYGTSLFTAAPSLFSFVVSAREYINAAA